MELGTLSTGELESLLDYLQSLPRDETQETERLMAELLGLDQRNKTPDQVRAETSYYEFVKQAWSVVEPDVEYADNWHIFEICRHLEAMIRGDIENLLINVPPGCMKSLLVGVFLVPWVWIHRPGFRFLFASYEQTLSVRDSMKCRDILRSEWYQDQWGDRFSISRDADEKTHFATTKGGWRMATSVGGRGTGAHPDFIGVDDPHKALAAESLIEQQSKIEWWTGTVGTRGMSRNVRKCLVMQRLAVGDLSGHVLTTNGGDATELKDTSEWDHICLPMRAEPGRAPETRLGFTDPRQPGELLWPSLFNERAVRRLERTLGSQRAAGQLQQRPVRKGGQLLKGEWFEIRKMTVRDAMRKAVAGVRFWDMAATEDDGDYTVGVLQLLMEDGTICIADVHRGQWGANRRDSRIQNTANVDGFNVSVRWEEEGGSAGKTVTAHFVRMLRGWDAAGVRPTGSKEVRLQPFQAYAEAGNVWLIQADWNLEYLDELESFPKGLHDDQVDATSGGFNFLAGRDDYQPVIDDIIASGQPEDIAADAEDPDGWKQDLDPWLKEILDATRGDQDDDRFDFG